MTDAAFTKLIRDVDVVWTGACITSEDVAPTQNRAKPRDARPDLSDRTGRFIFDPYNAANVAVSKADVEQLLSRFGADSCIRDFGIYERAFTHASYVHRPYMSALSADVRARVDHVPISATTACFPLRPASNERLEFLGDGVLELVAKSCLYARFPQQDEGFMSRKKIDMVKNGTVGKHAISMGLGKWYVVSRGTDARTSAEGSAMRESPKFMGNLFEALMGAIFVDAGGAVGDPEGDARGMLQASAFAEGVFAEYVDWDRLARTDDNFVNQLQVRVQADLRGLQIVPKHVIATKQTDSYHMCACICINVPLHEAEKPGAVAAAEKLGSGRAKTLAIVAAAARAGDRMIVSLGEGRARTKGDATQAACRAALAKLEA
jgi:dsRNA-specific ribonuclease